MANPQLKNGHTRIANEIMEQLMKADLNGTQLKIVIALLRYTYGFRRKQHELSVNFFCKALDTKSRSFIDKEINSLIERKVIINHGAGANRSRVLSFNKNYDEWLPKEEVSTNSGMSTNTRTPVSTNSRTRLYTNSGTKKERTKEKIKETRKRKTYDEEDTYFKMAKHFLGLVTEVAKDAGVEHLIAKANLQKWADDFRKLVELDGVDDKKLILKVMKWTTQDDFWRKNVLSAKKFREKFTDLAIKMNDSPSSKTKPIDNKPDARDIEIARNKWIAAGGDPDGFIYNGG